MRACDLGMHSKLGASAISRMQIQTMLIHIHPTTMQGLRHQLNDTACLLDLSLRLLAKEPRPYNQWYLRNPSLAQHLRIA